MSVYELLLFIHISAVACWIGGAVMFNVLAMRSGQKGQNPEGVIHTAEQAEWLGKFYYPPIAIVTLLAGIALVLKSDGVWDFQDPFVVIGIAVIVFSGVLGGTFYAKNTEALVTGINERGMDAASMAILKRIVLVSNLETLLLFFTVFMMVTKLGNG